MKTAILLAVSIAASGAALVAQAPGQSPEGARPDHRVIQKVLVKVNGEVFTQTELERLEVDEIRKNKPSINTADEIKADAKLLAMLGDVTPDILVEKIDELLLVQYGRELGLHMTDARFKDFVEQFKADKKINDTELQAALAEEGLTMEAWREMAEHSMIIRDVQQNELLPKAQVTEEELHQFYNANHGKFMTPSTMTFREILIKVPTLMQNNKPVINAAADEDARNRAAAIRERIARGEDFLKLVAEVSESDTKDTGGLLGPFNLDDIDPSLRAKVEPMKLGDVTEPLRTGRGYQILKIDSVSPPQLKPFDKVRDDLRNEVGNSRLDVEQQKFLVKIRAEALIEWKDDTLKKMYEKRLAERAAGK